MLLIENLFVMDNYIMKLQQLIDLGKQMNLAGKENCWHLSKLNKR